MRQVLILRLSVAALHRIKVARLHLVPEAAADLAVAHLADCARPGRPVTLTAGFLIRADDVVLACLDRLGGEKGVKLVPPGILVGPLPDGGEHVLLDLDVIIADRGVVEGTENVVDDFVDGNASMFPGIKDATVIL